MRFQPQCPAALAAALSLALLPAARAERPPQDAAERLDAVVVTVPPGPSTTTVTDPRRARQPVPASDGADYLETIPGFGSVRNGGTNGDPVLRGMFGSRLNLLSNDGMMPGGCPSRMDNPLSYVAPESFDRLVVTKGPQTVRWGPGASAGTVRFERETPSFAEREWQTRGSLLFGTAGRVDGTADITLGGRNGYARVDMNRSRADDYRDGSGRVVPSAWDKWNADLTLGWSPDDVTDFTLGLGRGDGEARYAGRSMDGTRFVREAYSLRATRAFNGRLRAVEASVYDNTADHVMDNYTLRDPNPSGAMPVPMGSNVVRRTRGGRVAADWTIGTWSLAFGIDGSHSAHEGRNARGVDAWRARPLIEDAWFRNLGVFGEATWSLRVDRRLALGARVDRADARDLRHTIGMVGMPNAGYGARRHEVLRSGFVRIEQGAPERRLAWFAGIGHVERMPDYWELVSPNVGETGRMDAFMRVRPEQTTQFDAGLQWRSGRLDGWASVFASHIDDYILIDYVPGGPMGTRTQVRNVDARTHGAEAGLRWTANDAWVLDGSVAWAHGDNRSQSRPLPQMPPLEARLAATWSRDAWSVTGLWRVAAAQDRLAPGQGTIVGRDLDRSPGFATLSLSASRSLGERWQVALGVDNLFDRGYAEHLNLAGSADFGYPADPVRIHEPGRTWWLKLSLR